MAKKTQTDPTKPNQMNETSQNPLDYLIIVNLDCMPNVSFLGRGRRISSFRGYLSPAQFELIWVLAGLGSDLQTIVNRPQAENSGLYNVLKIAWFVTIDEQKYIY